MSEYSELIQAVEDMNAQSKLFQPGAFWTEASRQITAEIQELGLENFRRLPTALGFFVPTYGCPGNGLSLRSCNQLREVLRAEQSTRMKNWLTLDMFLSGEQQALADYRVLVAADDCSRLPYLHQFSESSVGNPIEQFEFAGCLFSRSSLNYLLGMALLKKHLRRDEPRVVMEIGGGFGTLGEILFSAGIDRLKYIDLDIPPVSFVAQYYLGELLGKANLATYSQTWQLPAIDIQQLPKASTLCAWQIEKLQGEIDLFVNFISFQEMEPEIVRNYLRHVVRLKTKWILLRNMREGKQVRKSKDEVGVDQPIRTGDYLSMLSGYELIESNVLPFGYQTVDGFHSEVLLFRRAP
jgi:putative sugar O-methyltransferase